MKEVLYEKEHKKTGICITCIRNGSRHAGRMRFRNGKGSTGDSKSSSAASGTSGDNLSADTSEHVDLTMYLIGDRTPDLMRFTPKSMRFWKRS